MYSRLFSPTLIVSLATAFSGTLLAKTPSPLTNLSRPLSFEPNRGQADQQVEFLAHGLNYKLFVSQGEAVIIAGHEVVRMQPVAANRATRGELIDPLPGISNYFIGNDPAKWRTNVPTYSRVRYASVYPGIDLIYYGNQRQLEYDFVVQPGGDPRRIALVFESKTAPALNSDGELVLHTSSGDLTWHKPVAYQEIGGKREAVHCAYLRKGKRLAFEVGAYDRTKPLVIDPVIVYSTYLGGSYRCCVGNGDSATAIAVDSEGHAYVTGTTIADDFPTEKPLQGNNANHSSAFVTKFDAAGSALVYSTYLGGSGSAQGSGIAVDKCGEAFITGFAGVGFPTTKNAFQAPDKCTGGCANAFVAKLGPKGAALIYSTYLGGSGGPNRIGDTGNGIAVDSSGNAYITGAAGSTDFPTKNAFQSKNHCTGCTNAFVTKFSAAGDALTYSTYVGGSGAGVGDNGTGIAVDGEGSAYVTGVTFSTDFPLEHPFQPTNNGVANFTSNAFVTKLAPAGNTLVYSTYLGGSGGFYEDQGHYFVGDGGAGIALDGHGHAHVAGFTSSTDFPTKNAFEPTLEAISDAFVTKLSSDGQTLVFSTYLGGSGNRFLNFEEEEVPIGDAGTGIAIDAAGDTYITGYTYSKDFPLKAAFQSTNPGYPNVASVAFVTKLCPAGTLLYSSYLGGSAPFGGDGGLGIAADGSGNAYLAGSASSTDFPTKDPFQKTNKGSTNGFVTKVSAK